MGAIFRGAASLTAALISRRNRKKTLRNIEKANTENRNVVTLGKTSVSGLIPANEPLSNLIISGGDDATRTSLIVQNVRQALSTNEAVIILHEGNQGLESELSSVCSASRYFRTINASNPYYDPIFRLSDVEAAKLIAEASPDKSRIGADGTLYIRAMMKLLRRKGITPYLRMLFTCPHDALHTVIVQTEQAGRLTPDEANAIRNDIAAGSSARASIEYFFSELDTCTDIIACKSQLAQSTSIAECIRHNGVISIDIGSANKTAQLSIIVSEIERCLELGSSCRVIVDAESITKSDKLTQLLNNSSSALSFTISTPDLGRFSGTTQDDIKTWIALSHKLIIFTHGIHAAEKLSNELGEYDKIELTYAHAGGNNIGQFGHGFAATNTVSTTANKREQKIKSDDITRLGYNEFFMLDNYTAGLVRGVVV